MTAHMMIAPGTRADGRWFDFPRRQRMSFVRRVHHLSWWEELTEPPFGSSNVELGTATLRTYAHPSWRVRLRFWVDSNLGADPILPAGYILPGTVVGTPLEQTRICWRCRDLGVIRPLEVQIHPTTECIGHQVADRLNIDLGGRPW